MLAAGAQRVEGGASKRRADHGPDLRSFVHDVVPADARTARSRGQQRRQYVHSRRLAGTVGAEEAIYLTGRNRDVDPVDCARPLLEFADEPARLDRVIGHRRRLATESNARAQVTSTAAAGNRD